MKPDAAPAIDDPKAYFSRELSWLAFVSRVIALAEDPELPLLERVKFAGISGMLHDEFFMKRVSGLKRQIDRGSTKKALDGLRPAEELESCRAELGGQVERLSRVVRDQLMPALAGEGLPILNHDELDKEQRAELRDYFRQAVQPILTPLAVDSEHPFPFISNLGLNLAVVLPNGNGGPDRFVRIKVPGNRPRWISLSSGGGVVPLEQVIAANLDLLYPKKKPSATHLFRVTRGADGEPAPEVQLAGESLEEPGRILRQVSNELKARRFAGVVRVQVDGSMPKKLRKWLARQLEVETSDVDPTAPFLGLSDLSQLRVPERADLHYAPHDPVPHPRLRRLDRENPTAIFEEIARGDVLLHHPYHSFDSSVLRLIESAAADPDVLAIKLTIYRTNRDSPIVRALAEASRRGKQVAVMVEVTARFDEAPNIAWGQYLEREGVHVAYGVERLKTHVKLALVVREERGEVRLYAHLGTGNYHTETAKLYEDVGVLTCNPEICTDVASVFNALTGTTPYEEHAALLVAPVSMRRRFTELIRREAEHARDGRPSGIQAKMNQLQDPAIIRELYRASQAGVPIGLNIRGLCCLRPGVPGLSETIRVFSTVGRFLEHSRIYRFANNGSPEVYIGSADWMKRNLNNRVETVAPVLDPQLRTQLERVLEVYGEDNSTVWDCRPDGVYERRRPSADEDARSAQETFIRMALEQSVTPPPQTEPTARRRRRSPARRPARTADAEAR